MYDQKSRFWLALFNWTTWAEYERAGGEIVGFKEKRLATVRQMQEGDIILCYMTGASRWIGALRVVGQPFLDNEREIWKLDRFGARVRVSPILKLSPENGVPMEELRDELAFFRRLRRPEAWSGFVRFAPRLLEEDDAERIFAALRAARDNPKTRPVTRAERNYQPEEY